MVRNLTRSKEKIRLAKESLQKTFTPTTMMGFKKAILQLLESEAAKNLSQAADFLGIPKLRAHSWYDDDPDWARLVRQAQQITADRLEEEIDEKGNIIGLIFRLKKLRPEYRENFKVEVHNEKTRVLLEELRQLGSLPMALPSPAPSLPAPEPNLLAETIKRVNEEALVKDLNNENKEKECV